jgi:hypothetical protein
MKPFGSGEPTLGGIWECSSHPLYIWQPRVTSTLANSLSASKVRVVTAIPIVTIN